jgi:hypothetical protein
MDEVVASLPLFRVVELIMITFHRNKNKLSRTFCGLLGTLSSSPYVLPYIRRFLI